MTDELWITLDAEAKLTYLRERLDGLGRVLSHLLERIEAVEARVRSGGAT